MDKSAETQEACTLKFMVIFGIIPLLNKGVDTNYEKNLVL